MNELLLQILGMVFTAGAVWGALRSDLKALHIRMGAVEQDANEAHRRIDRLLMNE